VPTTERLEQGTSLPHPPGGSEPSVHLGLDVLDSLEDNLVYRYGFRGFDGGTGNPLFTYQGFEYTANALDKVQRIYLGHGETLPPSCHRAFINFTNILIANHRNEVEKRNDVNYISLGGLWDLSATNPRRIALPGPQTEESLSPSLRVRILPYEARKLYLIKSVEPDCDVTFELVVEHAVTALECYRRSWRSIPEVVKHLTQVGKPFQTFIPRLPLFTGAASIRVCRPLGFRSKNFKFRRCDYTHYEDVRRAFFELPHSRAAIQAGGIIWRLGVDVLGAEVALRGPSPSAHEFGNIVTSPSGSQFVDDQLTVDEMDMLCGKYNCYTGSSVSSHL
jgi:hypothetical protein